MSHQEAAEQYRLALKRGLKYYKTALAQGNYPYPQVLDEILNESLSAGMVDLGLVNIPANLIVGTRSKGRQAAFAGNFMPLLEEETEFSVKWIHLCEAHLGDEGIRDPVRCWEFMGRFYVSEGNKRVSVLKSFDAPVIQGYVTRVLPCYSDDPAVQLYYEFLQFYSRCNLYQIRFSRPGSYEKLQTAMGFAPDHVWTPEEQRAFLALFSRFELVCSHMKNELADATVSDAILTCLQVFPLSELKAQSTEELQKTLTAMLPDLKTALQPSAIKVSTEPTEKDKSLLSKLIGITKSDHLQVAFLYAYDPEVSAWTRDHRQGQLDMAQAMGDRVDIREYWALNRDYDEKMAQAVGDGAELIFATTPQMIAACRKIAALHPSLRVLNCSLSQPYTGLRTYYSRTYEAKFITGAIAGAMAKEDRVGYIASYPIAGVPANINAFALGAQMTNPRACVELVWSSETENALSVLLDRGVTVISNRDAGDPKHAHWALDSGTYRIREDGSFQPLALPCWNWGRFYTQVVESVFNGSFDALGKTESMHAINYWWGMSSGVIDVQFSPALPEGIRRLAQHLSYDLRGGFFDPFLCRIQDQAMVLRNDGSHSLSPEEIMQMDWLCSNVVGHIPSLDALRPEALETAKILSLPREKQKG